MAANKSEQNDVGEIPNNSGAAITKKSKDDKKKRKENKADSSPCLITRIFGRWKRSVCMAKNGQSTDSLSDNLAASTDLMKTEIAPDSESERFKASVQQLLQDLPAAVENNSDGYIAEEAVASDHPSGSYPHVSYSRSNTSSATLSNNVRMGCNTCLFNAQPFIHGSAADTGADMSHSSNSLSRNVHTQIDYIHYLVPDLLQITKCGYYWGIMDRYEAERLLNNKPEGTFLLRDSAQEEFLFSVSFRRYGRSLHARIEQLNHSFSFDSHDPDVFASRTVCKLIEHYKDPSSCMFFEPMLLYPLNRTNPFSLQHLCRSIVCSKIAYDDISNLPLPATLKEYLRYYHYKQKVHVRRFENS